ncbi:MAG: hypothetical protein GKR98_03255 [Boseongicola sp.]|nr:MAG: hypothetical protein GKR98_03255 [Boseongicola sp.]
MSMLEDIADGLAKRAIDLIAKTGDEKIEARIADEIGSSSPTLQETFSTAMRIRKAEARALVLLAKYDAGDSIPLPAISSQPQD